MGVTVKVNERDGRERVWAATDGVATDGAATIDGRAVTAGGEGVGGAVDTAYGKDTDALVGMGANPKPVCYGAHSDEG